ncbi:MAG: hypothetical protein COA33_002215 [Fluviicola sp.]|nr:hypothetical protein [Fluviicola sp.]
MTGILEGLDLHDESFESILLRTDNHSLEFKIINYEVTDSEFYYLKKVIFNEVTFVNIPKFSLEKNYEIRSFNVFKRGDFSDVEFVMNESIAGAETWSICFTCKELIIDKTLYPSNITILK